MLKHCDHKHSTSKVHNTEFYNSDIYYAIRSCELNNLITAIQNGENINEIQDDTNFSYLHLLVENCDKKNEHKYGPMVYVLANGGINVNKKDSKARIALHLSVEKQLSEITTALIRAGSDLKQIDKELNSLRQDNPVKSDVQNVLEKFSPGLWEAVVQDDFPLVQKLVRSWCRVNIKRSGKTLLQFAINNAKSKDMIHFLDDSEVTLEFVHATLAGDEKRMLEFLMDSKPCNPIVMDISYQTYWFQNPTPRSLKDTALAMNLTHVLHLLPDEEEVGITQNNNCKNDILTTESLRKDSSDSCLSISDLTVYDFFHPTQFPYKKENSLENLTTDIRKDKKLKTYEERYHFHENDTFGYKTERNPKNMYHKRYDKHKFLNLKLNTSDSHILHTKDDKSKLCIIS